MRARLLLLTLIALSFNLAAQTGPGGVGDNTNNVLWMRAADLSGSEGDAITSWDDASGNSNGFEQAVVDDQPTLQVQDNIQVVRFDGQGDFLEEKSGFGGYTARTAFIVYRVDVSLQQQSATDDLGQLWGSYGEGVHIAVDSRSSQENYSFDGDSNERARFGKNGDDYGGAVEDSGDGEWLYNTFEIIAVEFNSDRPLTEHHIGELINPAGHFYGGDIAEIIVYNSTLNDAQKIIIENYLAGKYGITLTQNDFYAYQDNYGSEIAGIGQLAGSSNSSANSSSVLNINNPSDLANGEYLIFGNDGGSVNAWTTLNTPFSGSNISRVSREWIVDETGDVGTIDLTIDTSLFAARPAGYSKFVVMLDDDNDFTDAIRIYELVSGGANQYYSITGLEISDGDYITIAAVKPVVQFTLTESDGFEDEACSIEVSSNFVLQSDVTVQATIADVTATGGADYTVFVPNPQNVTITAGNISTNVTVVINDADGAEEDETFTITLSSATVDIGTNNVHTYTIKDNDDADKINFSLASSSVTEGTASIDVELVSTTTSSQVSYRIIGGTASGTDYTLVDGTVDFSGGTTQNINVSIINDDEPEPSETLEIELYNPLDANLNQGSNLTHTLTIDDDGDELRKISFLTDSVSKLESVTSYDILVGLTGSTGFDVTVDYTLSGNAAYGTDHNLAAGTITVSAGSTLATLELPIINDAVEEEMDTVIVTLSNPNNATLGTKTVMYYFILNEDFGYIGAGGVGSTVAIKQWLRADTLVTVDGSNKISEWGDFSGNGFGVTQATAAEQPTLVQDVINGQPAILFATTPQSSPTNGESLRWEDQVNGYQAQEVFAVVQTSLTDISTDNLGQIWGSYADGFHVALEARNSRGQNGFSFDGQENLNIGRAKYSLQGNDFTDTYYDNTKKDADQQKWVDDEATLIDADFQTVNVLNRNNVGWLESSGNYWYGGYIAEVIAYSSTVDTADRLIIKNYLAAKYGINIGAKDLYSHEGTHKHDVAGIGQYNSNNYHSAAQSARILKIASASDLGDGEYMLFGHDSADITGWTTTEVPSADYQRLAREWRFDQTGGSIGTVSLDFDLTNLPALPSNATQVVLLVDSDGDFTNGAQAYTLLDKGSNIYQVDNLTISDNDYVSLSCRIPTISFESVIMSVSEGDGSPSITISLSQEAPIDVTVDYALGADSTANSAGVDYTITEGTATIVAGSSSVDIDFTLNDETDSEGTEYFNVALSNPVNASFGNFSNITVYILDNDGLEADGPGGIGNLSDQVNVWFSSTNAGSLSDAQDVSIGTSAWINQTENAGLDAYQSVSTQRPRYYSEAVTWNDRPLLDFQRANRDFLEIPDNSFMNTAPNSSPQSQRSIFVVFRPSSDVSSRQVVFEEGGGARGLNIYIESGNIYLGAWNDVDDAGPGTAWSYTSSNDAITGNQPYFALLEFDLDGVDDEVRGTVNGTSLGAIAGAGLLYSHGGDIGIGAMNNGACFDGDDCDGGEDHYFDGYIAEFGSTNVIYNEAQKIILFNYFSSKFGIALPSNDYFAYDVNNAYSYELFGIGQVDLDNSHTAAQGTGIVKIENPQNLGNGEYMFIGHDTNDIDGWVQSNIPNADSNIYRVERTWRVDETGDLGGIKVKVDTSLFAAQPAGTDYYCIIIDADGDFTSGATVRLITEKDVDDNNLYYIDGIDFTKGDYFTFGCVKPSVDFMLSSAESTEANESKTTELKLNVIYSSDVTVDYTFNDVEAVNGAVINTHDYTGTSGTATITAGNTSTTIPFDILDDTNGETNETFTIELSNVNPPEVAIGYDTTFTYTIIDNDETRKVSFGEVSRSGAEDIAAAEDTAFVILTTPAPGSGVTVDYEILTSSTATNGAVDFDIASSGTLNFASGEDSVLLIFDIVDDILDEQDETINIQLSNPTGLLNLGDDVDFTYTIIDNDDLPEVQFTVDNASGMESFSPIDVEVTLSAVSGQDVIVDYSVSGSSTATSGGIDYTLSTSSVTVPAGETTANFQLVIVNDKGQDDNETVIIDIDGATNATVNGLTQYTFTIIDDDFGGWEGPGGIGNLDNQVGCWLRSTQVYNITNGVDVGVSGSTTIWKDQSNNNNDAYDRDAGITYGSPVFYDDDATWNKRPVLWFKSSEKDILEIADNDEMNTPSGAQSQRTLLVVFRPTDDISSRQVIYEEGGGWRGLNIYIEDDTLNIGGYNINGAAHEVLWSYVPIRFELEPNTPYFAILQFDFEDGSGDVRGALNGSDFSVLPGADLLYPHGDNIGIGGVNGGARGINDVSLPSGSSYYNGYFAEFMSGNFVYNTAQLQILQNYLAAKYNIDIGTKDIYDYEAVHGWELLGIGQKTADNSHNKSQGQGKILLSNPSDLDDGEFMLIGHDAGLPFDADLTSGIGQWLEQDFIDIPNSDTNIIRVPQEWRIDMVGDVGTVNIDVDTSNVGTDGYFPAQEPDFPSYVIMIDNDGNFESGAEVYELKEDPIPGNEKYLVLEDYNFEVGDYFTIGLAQIAGGFTNATYEAMEDVGASQSLQVDLNVRSTKTITIDYKLVADEATIADYTDVSGTLTFAPGEFSKTIDVSLIDDGGQEDDEIFYVVLENPTNAVLTQDTLAFTIHDDDNANKISFSDVNIDATVSEDTVSGEYTVSVIRTDNTGTSEIDYEVTGGTAINGASDDFILADGTIAFADTQDSLTFNITINNDLIDEDTETIILNLTNPSGGSLGVNSQITLSIVDNDAEPEISFTTGTGQGAESFNPVFVAVSLSVESGKDVEVNYEAVDGSATNGGLDYNLFTPGSITIPAGSTTGEIEIEIINDLIATADKDFTINITGATNASVNLTADDYTYTILDDDDLGWEGPGGIGDSEQYSFWFRANGESYSNGDVVTPFNDQSTNNNDASAYSGSPEFATNVINGNAAVLFTSADSDMLQLPRNDDLIDNTSYTLKTMAVAFRTGGDIASRQVIYEQGGGNTGLSIYVYNNQVYFTAYNYTSGGWNMAAISSNVSINSNYYGMFIFNSDVGTFEAYLNGALIGTDNSISEPLPRANRRYNAIGGMYDGMRYEDGTNITGTDGNYFGGHIAELIQYNSALNVAQRIIVENYLAAKYGISVTNDRFAYESTHGYRLAGIGQQGTDNQIKARGTGMATLSEPVGMGSGDYLMIGDDNGDVTTWATEVGFYEESAQFMARRWRLSVTGSGITQAQIGIDIDSPVASNPADYPSYIVIVGEDADNNNEIDSGTEDIYLLKDKDGTTLRITATIEHGDLIRVGVARNRSVVDGEWHDPNTWLTGEVPSGSTATAYISAGQTVEIGDGVASNTLIGDIIIETGGTLLINERTTIYNSIQNDGNVTVGSNAWLYIYYDSEIINNSNFNFGTGTWALYIAGSYTSKIAGLDYYAIYTSNGNYEISENLTTTNFYQYYNGVVNVIGSPTIDISNVWTTNGSPTFNANQSTILFSGGGTQYSQIPSNLYNLEINKASGSVYVTNEINITNNLTLSSGILDLQGNDLNITNTNSNAITHPGDGSSYIQADGAGQLVRDVANGNTYEFPVGDANEYSPFTVTMNSSTLAAGADIGINVNDAKHGDLIDGSYITRWWQVTPSGISNPNYDVSYSYTDADIVGSEGALIPVKFDDGGGNMQRGELNANIDVATNTFTWSGITSFSEFTGSGFDALPVELLYFDGKEEGTSVLLTWATASEINNDYFEIQRSLDGVNFEVIGYMNGEGNSSSQIDYSYRDADPLIGTVYYRLNQIDYDGVNEYSKKISVTFNAVYSDEDAISIYPNPTNGLLNIKVNGNVESGEVRVMSQAGSILITTDITDSGSVVVDLTDLPQGLYMVSVVYNNNLETKVIHKN